MSNTLIRRSAGPIAALTIVTAAGWLAPSSLSAVQASWTALSRSDPRSEPHVEDAVLLLCGTVLAAVLAWLVLSVVVCSITAGRHGVAALGDGGPLRPRLARALVSTVVGALVATTAGAEAAGGPAPGVPALPARLDGLALPERPYGGIRTHQVTVGESLWSITVGLLPDGAADHTVARTWPRLHELNRDRIGPDPDVIRPGTALRLPAWAPVPTRGAAR